MLTCSVEGIFYEECKIDNVLTMLLECGRPNIIPLSTCNLAGTFYMEHQIDNVLTRTEQNRTCNVARTFYKVC